MDNLRPYGEPRWAALTLLLLAPPLIVGACAVLRSRRDLGGAVFTSADTSSPHVALLRSPSAVAFRSSRGVLLAWSLGLAAYAALIGSLLPTMVDYLLEEPGLRKALEMYGLDSENIEQGMVSFLSTVFGLAFGLYGCWRIGAARQEEASGRAELLLVRPLTRRRWLVGHVVLATLTTVVLASTAGLSMWAGGWLAGAELSARDAVAASLNSLPAVMLLVAVAVVAMGLWPRATVPLSATAAGIAYLLPVLGRGLSLPMWVRDVSPFQHLAAVPVKPFALTPGVVMLGLAVALAALGVAAFARRDLVGS